MNVVLTLDHPHVCECVCVCVCVCVRGCDIGQAVIDVILFPLAPPILFQRKRVRYSELDFEVRFVPRIPSIGLSLLSSASAKTLSDA